MEGRVLLWLCIFSSVYQFWTVSIKITTSISNWVRATQVSGTNIGDMVWRRLMKYGLYIPIHTLTQNYLIIFCLNLYHLILFSFTNFVVSYTTVYNSDHPHRLTLFTSIKFKNLFVPKTHYNSSLCTRDHLPTTTHLDVQYLQLVKLWILCSHNFSDLLYSKTFV